MAFGVGDVVADFVAVESEEEVERETEPSQVEPIVPPSVDSWIPSRTGLPESAPVSQTRKTQRQGVESLPP